MLRLMDWVMKGPAWNKQALEKNKHYHYGVALHFFARDQVQWQNWHHYVASLWEDAGLKPNKAITNGGEFGLTTRMGSYKGMCKKFEKFNYQGINNSTLKIIPKGEEYMDKYISSSAISSGIYQDGDEENMHRAEAYFLIRDDVIEYEFNYFLDIAKHLHEYSGAIYGYYFKHPTLASPESYITGHDEHSITMREYQRNIKWNFDLVYREERKALEARKLIHLRDIYKINFLSQQHLELAIDDRGTSLQDWIRANPLGIEWEFAELSKDFYYWHIGDESNFPHIINAISRIVICNYDNLEGCEELEKIARRKKAAHD